MRGPLTGPGRALDGPVRHAQDRLITNGEVGSTWSGRARGLAWVRLVAGCCRVSAADAGMTLWGLLGRRFDRLGAGSRFRCTALGNESGGG